MRKSVIVTLFAAMLGLVTPARAIGSAEAVLAEARAALDAGNADQARRLVDEGLKEAGLAPPERARMLLDRGLAFELLGTHDQALIDLTAAINIHALPAGEQAQALLQRGFLLDSQSRLNDAVGDYSSAIRLSPETAKTALNNRANIYRRQNRLKEARRDYLAALDGGNPHPEYPYTGLGQIAEAEGDIEAARRYYAQATAANAHYAPAIERLAALGGPPPDSRTDPGVVHLKPPGAAPRPVDPPIVLTPPAGAPAAQGTPQAASPAPAAAPIHLHMPTKAARAHGDSPSPPGLRPAIDGGVGSGGAQLVQLGAWRSRAEAEAGWQRAKTRAGGVLDGLADSIQEANLPGKGLYYRLRVAPGPAGAKTLCDALSARGMDCLIVRK